VILRFLKFKKEEDKLGKEEKGDGENLSGHILYLQPFHCVFVKLHAPPLFPSYLSIYTSSAL
jgi:hypothetical protein